MSVVMLIDNPAGSQEIYEKVRRQIGLDGPAGGVLHVAGPGPQGGWRVVEVFSSEDDARRFVTEHLAPALEAIGAPRPPKPEIWPVHACVTADGARR